MKLPNGERAVVEIQKLTDYCLSLEHPRGRHKARVFEAVLGLTAQDAESLHNALLEAALTCDAATGEGDDFGQRYIVDFLMRGPAAEAVVRSSWIVRRGEDFARLTSCFVR